MSFRDVKGAILEWGSEKFKGPILEWRSEKFKGRILEKMPFLPSISIKFLNRNVYFQ